MTTKNCTTCKKSKPLSEFSADKRGRYGRHSICRQCVTAYLRTYNKTKNGITSRIYGHQRQNSIRRGNGPPEYTLEELRAWIYSQPIFHKLYKEWARSGYNKMLKPSCDREDDYQGYSLNRLRIMTWQENKDKGHSDRKNGINNKVNKPIIQMDINGSFIKEFHSLRETQRQINIDHSSISRCCFGKQKTAGGYRFMFSLGIEINNNISGTKSCA